MKRELAEQELRLISILLDPDLDEAFYPSNDFDSYDDDYFSNEEWPEPDYESDPSFEQEFEQDIEDSDRYSR